jgi:ABC-type multidrug transport system fused ATPase/permease subunit
MDAARSNELRVYRKSIYLQVASGMVYTALPLAVGISTFSLYVALGNELDVATALTSLALFEILRFPLFILPTVINNIAEAGVSVDRVQSFLLEPDKIPVPSEPLTKPGIQFNNATLVYESIKQRLSKPTSELSTTQTNSMERDATQEETATNEKSSTFGLILKGCTKMVGLFKAMLLFIWGCFCGTFSTPSKTAPNMTDVEFELLVRRAQVEAAEERLVVFEKEHKSQQKTNGDAVMASSDSVRMTIRKKSARSSRRLQALQDEDDREAAAAATTTPGATSNNPLLDASAGGGKGKGDIELTVTEKYEDKGQQGGSGERVLTLFRVSMKAQRGSLLCIVGRVGSGKV